MIFVAETMKQICMKINFILPEKKMCFCLQTWLRETLYRQCNRHYILHTTITTKCLNLGGGVRGQKYPHTLPPMRGHFAFCQSDSRHRQNPPSAAWAYCTRNTRLSQGIKSTKRIYLKTKIRG